MRRAPEPFTKTARDRDLAAIDRLLYALVDLRRAAQEDPSGIRYEGTRYRAYLAADHILNQIDEVAYEADRLAPLELASPDESHQLVMQEAARDFYATR